MRTGHCSTSRASSRAFREDTVFGSEMYNKTIGLVFGPTILGMHGKQHHDHRSLVSKAFHRARSRSGNPR